MHQKDKEFFKKKWSLVGGSLLVGGLLLLGTYADVVLGAVNESNTATLERGRLAKSQAAIKHYDVRYPVTHVEKVDEAMRSYATRRVDAFLQQLGDREIDPRNDLTLHYSVLHFGTRTATVAFEEQQQLFNQPPNSSQTVMTFDLESQKRLELADVFKDKAIAEQTVGRILHDYFQHNMTAQLSPVELRQLSHFQFSNVRDFRLVNDRIVLYLDPSNLISGKNIQTIQIKKELLADVLKSAYAPPDPSILRGASEQAVYTIDVMPKHEIAIDPNGKMLALTFDDGPGVLTPQVLDVLKKHDAHATFFLIGRQVSTYPGVVKRTIAEGNEIGNHTWDHPNLTKLPLGEIGRQVERTQQVIHQVTGGYTPLLLRPPGCAFNDTVTSYAGTHKLSLALWNVDTRDWLDRDAQLVYSRIMESAADGRVILLHDIHPTSVEAAVRAVPDLVAQGYQLVTVSELDHYR